MIDINKLILTIILFSLFSVFVTAESSKLIITDLDVTLENIEGDTNTAKNLADGETIRYEASPESKLKFDIEITNNYTSSEDLEIEDIIVTVYIKDIDDGDDLEEESDEFSLKPNKDKKVSLEFDIPLEVEENTYDVEIEVAGEDENGTKHSVLWTVYLDVEKEKHMLRLKKAELEKTSLQCSDYTYLDIELINIGTSEEEDIELTIQNPDLDIDVIREFTLSEEPFDSDSVYEERIPISIPEDVEGSYPLRLKVLYGSKVLERNIPLDVTCQKAEPLKTEQPESEQQTLSKEETITSSLTQQVLQPTITIKEPLLERYKYTIAVIIAYLFVLTALFVFAVRIFKKR